MNRILYVCSMTGGLDANVGELILYVKYAEFEQHLEHLKIA